MGILVFSYLVEHHSLEELAAAVFLNLSFMILLLYLLHFSAWLDQEPRGHRAGSRYVGHVRRANKFGHASELHKIPRICCNSHNKLIANDLCTV